MTYPNIFKNTNISISNNDQEVFYSKKKNEHKVRTNEYIPVDLKINNIFKSSKYVYKIDVLIKTNESEKKETIIGKIGNNLITINNKIIPIDSIIDINELN